jgi:hypothetical protein
VMFFVFICSNTNSWTSVGKSLMLTFELTSVVLFAADLLVRLFWEFSLTSGTGGA